MSPGSPRGEFLSPQGACSGGRKGDHAGWRCGLHETHCFAEAIFTLSHRVGPGEDGKCNAIGEVRKHINWLGK